jgi:hypothetical protein
MQKLTTLIQWFCPSCKHSNFDFSGADFICCENCNKIWSWIDLLEKCGIINNDRIH